VTPLIVGLLVPIARVVVPLVVLIVIAYAIYSLLT
jgi:hypothetical protein